MRTTLKIVLPLIVSVVVVSLVFAFYQVRTEKRVSKSELSRTAQKRAEDLQDAIEQLPDRSFEKAQQRLVDRFGQREHLKGIIVYNTSGAVVASTQGLTSFFPVRPPAAVQAAEHDSGYGEFTRANNTAIQVYALPLHRNDQASGTLVLVHDASFIDTQVAHTLRDSLLHALVQTLFITGLALVLVRWALMGPLTRNAKWLRTLRTGQPTSPPPPSLPHGGVFEQIHREVTHLARDLTAARATAQEEARLRDSNVAVWTAERLRVSLSSKLQNKPLFVVSNREPYMHVYNNGNNGSIQVIVPASGFVPAVA